MTTTTTRHLWQCGWWESETPADCDCGVLHPRAAWHACFPHERPPTEREIKQGLRKMAKLLQHKVTQ